MTNVRGRLERLEATVRASEAEAEAEAATEPEFYSGAELERVGRLILEAVEAVAPPGEARSIVLGQVRLAFWGDDGADNGNAAYFRDKPCPATVLECQVRTALWAVRQWLGADTRAAVDEWLAARSAPPEEGAPEN